jgi:hypothetical protein
MLQDRVCKAIFLAKHLSSQVLCSTELSKLFRRMHGVVLIDERIMLPWRVEARPLIEKFFHLSVMTGTKIRWESQFLMSLARYVEGILPGPSRCFIAADFLVVGEECLPFVFAGCCSSVVESSIGDVACNLHLLLRSCLHEIVLVSHQLHSVVLFLLCVN